MLQKTAKGIVIAGFTAFLTISLGAQHPSFLQSPVTASSARPVSAVPNAPFSAEVTVRYTCPLPFSSVQTSFNIARDINGRTYDDMRGSLGYQKEITRHIYDPATRLDTVLIGEQHHALQWKVNEVPEYETNPKYDRTPINFEPPYIATGEWAWRKEDLGTQTMEGVTVHGVRFIRHVPASASGTGQPVEVLDEFWYSSELRLNLLVKRTDPPNGEETFAITHLRRSDPDPQLFEIPEGFIVVDRYTGFAK